MYNNSSARQFCSCSAVTKTKQNNTNKKPPIQIKIKNSHLQQMSDESPNLYMQKHIAAMIQTFIPLSSCFAVNVRSNISVHCQSGPQRPGTSQHRISLFQFVPAKFRSRIHPFLV